MNQDALAVVRGHPRNLGSPVSNPRRPSTVSEPLPGSSLASTRRTCPFPTGPSFRNSCKINSPDIDAGISNKPTPILPPGIGHFSQETLPLACGVFPGVTSPDMSIDPPDFPFSKNSVRKTVGSTYLPFASTRETSPSQFNGVCIKPCWNVKSVFCLLGLI